MSHLWNERNTWAKKDRYSTSRPTLRLSNWEAFGKIKSWSAIRLAKVDSTWSWLGIERHDFRGSIKEKFCAQTSKTFSCVSITKRAFLEFKPKCKIFKFFFQKLPDRIECSCRLNSITKYMIMISGSWRVFWINEIWLNHKWTKNIKLLRMIHRYILETELISRISITFSITTAYQPSSINVSWCDAHSTNDVIIFIFHFCHIHFTIDLISWRFSRRFSDNWILDNILRTSECKHFVAGLKIRMILAQIWHKNHLLHD